MNVKERKALEAEYRQKLLDFADKYDPNSDIRRYVFFQQLKGIVVVNVKKHCGADSPKIRGVVLFGERLAGREVYVLLDDMAEYATWRKPLCAAYVAETPLTLEFVTPGPRKIYFPPGFYGGNTSLMARLGNSMRSGRMFRGR